MIDDYDLEFTSREARLVKERDYWADRYRDSRLWRRDSERDHERRIDRDDDCLRVERGHDHTAVVQEEIAEDRRERRLLGIAGFGLGGGGAVLVVLGILLMAVAYFGLGMLDTYGGYGPAEAYDTSGYSPAVDAFVPGVSSSAGYAGTDLLSQRPMMFMGGGFLFLAGWIVVMASRMRSFLSDDL